MNNLNETQVLIKDTFRILIATDIHLGYAENDPERGDDSFIAFEEILQLAKDQEVDFILLGGDLFHENKPSTDCIHKCSLLLRKYCMGDNPVSIEFLSDQNVNFQHCSQPIVNYQDPNFNISIPVFSIHGNHDDPSGSLQLCTLDILSTVGLLNYFGKWTDLSEVKILPILLRKGTSRLAMYGLSHIKDERLSRLFRDQQVHMYRPSEHTDEWFNIFVCHQNRADRGLNKYIPEEALPDFLNLVVWGHEHECRLKEEWNSQGEFHVTQPGSSVATSLCEGEAKPKFVGLLHVVGKKFKLVPFPLKTVRPFVFETIKLSDCTLPVSERNTSDNVQTYLEERVNFFLMQSNMQISGHPKQPKLPLIRVRVEYNDEDQCFNTIRFGQKYLSEVANPTDMVMLKREKKVAKKGKNNLIHDRESLEEFLQNEEVDDVWEIKMNLIIERYYNEVSDTKKLRVLTIPGINNAAAAYIDKRCTNSFKKIIEHQMNKTENYLFDKKANLEDLDHEIENFGIERSRNAADEEREIKIKLESGSNGFPLPSGSGADLSRISDSDNEDYDNVNVSFDQPIIAPKVRGGRGRARGAARARAGTSATRARARGRASQASQAPSSTRQPNRSSTTAQKAQMFSRLKYDDSDSD